MFLLWQTVGYAVVAGFFVMVIVVMSDLRIRTSFLEWFLLSSLWPRRILYSDFTYPIQHLYVVGFKAMDRSTDGVER